MDIFEDLAAPGAHERSEEAMDGMIRDFGVDEATAQLLEEFAGRIRAGQYPVIHLRTQTTAEAPETRLRRGRGRVFTFTFTTEIDV